MTTSFSIVPVLYLLGLAHGLFLAVALLTKKSGPRLANTYLGLYTLVFVCALFDYFLDATGLVQQYVYMRTLLWPKEFLYGVLIYFYTREMTHPGEYQLKGRQWWHFVPPILHVLVTWPLLLMPAAMQVRVLTDAPASSWLEQVWALSLGDVELLLSVIHVSIYLVLSMRLVMAYQREILSQFSNIERVTLVWLQNLLIGTMVVYVCWLVDALVDFDPVVERWTAAVLGVSMVGLIYSMSFLGLRQPQVFSAGALSTVQDDALLDRSADNSDTEKYSHSPLSKDMSASLYEELTARMVRDQLYKDNDLSLPKLAAEIGVSVNYLSQVINQQARQNFFDFINRYRIDEVQQQIRITPDATVLAIALNAGFNSKSAFYTAFRKHSGMTPSQYKKSLAT